MAEIFVPQSLCWRPFLAGLLLLTAMAVSAPARAAEDSETIRLVAGSSAVIALTENPSTGYRWRLNKEASTDLPLVAISDAGFDAGGGKPLIGAPGTRRFRIVARRSGIAIAVFDYVRPWEHAAGSRRHTVNIHATER